MKIFNKIAIEPKSISSWEQFRYVMEKLGYSKGLVLAKFPKAWERELIDGLDVSDIQKTRIVAKLQAYKTDRMMPSGLPYQGDISWSDNLMSIIDTTDIDRAIFSENPNSVSSGREFITIEEADETYFQVPNDIQVLNSPIELSQPAKLLLKISEVAVIVDPYFQIATSPEFIETLSNFIKLAIDGGKCRVFTVYIKVKQYPKGAESAIENALSSFLDVTPKLVVNFLYIDDLNSAYPLHARYFLTEKSGLRYDKGFQSTRRQEEPVNVDISLIDTDLHSSLVERFINRNNDYTIEHEHKWVSCGE
ncbi:MAG: hypothetical protein P1U35_12195 [Cycloclasticus sp.]|nr:hypothetical protein [Cycloclasticus sp.]